MGNVFCKVPLDWLLHHGFHLVPPDELERVVAVAEENIELARVVSGLESLVVGEAQIQGQVGRAYAEGRAGVTGLKSKASPVVSRGQCVNNPRE